MLIQYQTIATASASDCACRGSRRLLRSDVPELRRIFRTETGALPHGDDSDEPQGIAMDVPLLPQPWSRPLMRNAHQAVDECCHTRPARLASPHSHLESRLQPALRFLKQARLDLLPRDDIRRILLVPSNSVIKLRPLRIRQRYRVRFQAFPDRIQQFRLLRSGQAIDLASQIAHMPSTLARFLGDSKQQHIPRQG